MSMTNPADRVEIITSVQRPRRWTASEKVRIVEETFEPGMTVSLVARRHGVAPNQLFTWRRLVAQGALTAAGNWLGLSLAQMGTLGILNVFVCPPLRSLFRNVRPSTRLLS